MVKKANNQNKKECEHAVVDTTCEPVIATLRQVASGKKMNRKMAKTGIYCYNDSVNLIRKIGK